MHGQLGISFYECLIMFQTVTKCPHCLPWELLWETHPLPHIVIYHPLRSKWGFKYTQCKDKHQSQACICYIHPKKTKHY